MSKARRIFGTDGVRGQANQFPMTVETALQLGRALAYLVSERRLGQCKDGHRPRIVLGKDTRLSGYMIEQAIAAGVCSMGVDVMLVGPLPTPGVAFITRSMRADAGIMVSASHNPFDDNGIKIFGHDGFKLPDPVELEIEELIFGDELNDIRPVGTAIGRARRIDDAVGRYVVYLKNVFPAAKTLDGVKIVIDCANGAAYKVAPEVFRELGADVITLGVSPNGTNINEKAGSLFPENIQNAVLEHGADIGIALDGDADRVIVVDEKGETVSGDAIMAICAIEAKRTGQLRNDTLVATVMSNIGLEHCLASVGIALARTQVGDRYVVENMRHTGCNLGGENSGHIILLDHSTTGDGMVASLILLGIMVKESRAVSDLASVFTPAPQELLNIAVQKKVPLEKLPDVAASIKEVEQKYGKNGRVLVRYSGTEMKARVMVEGASDEDVKKDAAHIARALQAALSA
jgi:phosphoglucosamine mutase